MKKKIRRSLSGVGFGLIFGILLEKILANVDTEDFEVYRSETEDNPAHKNRGLESKNENPDFQDVIVIESKLNDDLDGTY